MAEVIQSMVRFSGNVEKVTAMAVAVGGTGESPLTFFSNYDFGSVPRRTERKSSPPFGENIRDTFRAIKG